MTYATSVEAAQLVLPLLKNGPTSPVEGGQLGVTFRDTLTEPVFGWYPYVEGFSVKYTTEALQSFKPRAVYDPFAGSGTTQLAASCLGIPSFYAEVNPFMRFVAETKVTAVRSALAAIDRFQRECRCFMKALRDPSFATRAHRQSLVSYEGAFPERDFFELPHLKALLAAVELAHEVGTEPFVRDVLLLACAANAVASSNMTRRADLRRRRDDEYKDRVVDVPKQIASTVARFLDDVARVHPLASMMHISNDARAIPEEHDDTFDLALTSPPYLNGTNYFRNTKIELWLLGFLASERELSRYRREAIAAGINNVTRTRATPHQFEPVERVVAQLQQTDGDMRIPLLVRQYCSDMFEVFRATRAALKKNGVFLLDIGDSKFYGVHVPTDALLVHAAEEAGMRLARRRVLARRHSRDKSELVQVELLFKKGGKVVRRPAEAEVPKPVVARAKRGTIEGKIEAFQKSLPYQLQPYCKRNWGHDLHSLCSYQGKLKPALAHWLIREFSQPNGRVLDPLGGVGTIAFEAALMGRDAVSNDMSPFAATVAAAKLNPPTIEEFESAATNLTARIKKTKLGSKDTEAADFGLNGTVKEFFHETTLVEVLQARKLFLSQTEWSQAETFFWASLLHVLHGNRPYALSRRSHPITPFHPTGPYVYKNLSEKVLARARAVLSSALPNTFRAGLGIQGDFRALATAKTGRFDAIITSPPFIGMRFDRPNWLRLWFCGWGEQDFHVQSLGFLERQQTSSRDCYLSFFETMSDLITNDGIMILHVGSGGAKNLVGDLRRLADDRFRLLGEVVENVQAVEQHGVLDKGLTSHHHLLFLRPR